MPDRVVPGPVGNAASIREAVSIHTSKIFDCCRDKDCVDELRVYPTLTSQTYLDNAISIRPKAAELLFTNVNVEPVSFNRGYFTVDCTYFYRVTAETFPGGALCRGLAVFDKRVMLIGSEGSVKTFTSVLDLEIEDDGSGCVHEALIFSALDPYLDRHKALRSRDTLRKVLHREERTSKEDRILGTVIRDFIGLRIIYSEISISCLVRGSKLKEAVNAIHNEFFPAK